MLSSARSKMAEFVQCKLYCLDEFDYLYMSIMTTLRGSEQCNVFIISIIIITVLIAESRQCYVGTKAWTQFLSSTRAGTEAYRVSGSDIY